MMALALLTFCTTLAVMIYLNIQQNTQPFARLKAQQLAESHMRKLLTNTSVSDYEKTEDGLIIRCLSGEVNTFGQRVIKVKVFNSGNKLLSEIKIYK